MKMFSNRESNFSSNSKDMDAQTNTNNSWRQENTPDKLKCNKSSRKRKRRRSSTDDDDDEELDTSIDAKLKQSAMRNNLTPQNVRNILQKVVRNDHVLAIVKLKEEEMERHEQTKKKPKIMTETSDNVSIIKANDGIDDSENTVPKLTRAKAKALNKYPLPVAPPFKHSQTEVVALISEDLHSDDDDEEYQPGEDENESDDEINTTTSDIDSQPATPSSQIDASEEPRIIYSNDGLFKVPRARNDSITDNTSQTEQEYIIAQRTRSKISLAETPIEAIESTFKAPDVSQDMYVTMEPDEDPYWLEFLNDLCTNPKSEMEKEDEDEDTDYYPMTVDSQPDDREEYQHANVPKKEVDDLMADFISSIDKNVLSNLETIDLVDLLDFDQNTSKQTLTVQEDLSQSLVTPIKHSGHNDEQLTTPESTKIQTQSQSQQSDQSPISSNLGMSYFDPIIISTPVVTNYNNASITGNNQPPPQQQQQQQSFDSFNSSFLLNNELPVQYTYSNLNNGYTVTPMQENSPVMTFITNTNISSNNFTLPYNPNVITTYDSNTTPTMPASVISSIESNKVDDSLRKQIEEGPMPKTPGRRSKRSRFKTAEYKDLENLNLNSFKSPDLTAPDERGFTFQQRLILEEQLRMYVQLTTQNYIQTYGHPKFYIEAPKIKQCLIDLVNIVERGNADALSVYNLKPAVELISRWECELSLDSKENTDYFFHLQNEMNKLRKNLSYDMKFHERTLHFISESKVFMYPQLLPKIPFRFKTQKYSEYFPAEDYLLAFLLEHFFEELQHKVTNYKFSKPKEVNLNYVCKHISAHLNYFRPWKSIYDYVRFRRSNELMNPIKFYFKHKRAPPTQFVYGELFNSISSKKIFNPELEAIEPAKQLLKNLSPQWAQYVEKLIGLSYEDTLNQSNGHTCKINQQQIETNHQKLISKKPDFSIADSSSQINQGVSQLDINGTLVHVKIIYDKIAETHNNNINGDISSSSGIINKGQTLLTSYFHPIKQKDNVDDLESSVQLTNIIESLVQEKVSNIDKKYLFRQRKQIIRRYRKYISRKYLARQRTATFLVHITRRLHRKYSTHPRLRHNENVSLVYRCLIIFHRYTTELVNCVKYKITQISSNMSTETLIASRRVQKIINDNVSEENNHIVQQQQTDASVKRLPTKNQRTSDSNRLLLLSENAQESSEKDFLFAQRFIERVEEIFINENNHHKFTEFLAILRKFNDNQQHQSGADLYVILEKFLLPDYPEIMDLFLNFLSPSDAVEINRSMEYFLKVNLSKFLTKLNIFFQKQPAQIRKILACLRELSDDSDVTFDRIRSRLVPLMKGNHLLIDWFLQCFGPEKECDSTKDEYETLILRKGTETFDDDQFEYIPQSEIVPDPNDAPCHIRYMNGRLFYGSRFPLPAKLSFSALPCTPSKPSTYLNSIDQVIDKSLTQYHCVHNIKEFADSKMRDKHHSELEHIGCNGTNEEIENSDEDQQQVERNDDRNDIETNDGDHATTSNILCDNTLLRAHSIRLNPTLHSTSLHQSNADILNKLKPPEQLFAESTNKDKDLRLSPKKQSLSKCTTNIHAKPSTIRKNSPSTSPNTKKITLGACKSPNNKKTISPNLSDTSSYQTSSNAIQTAKRLKRILEINEPVATSTQSIGAKSKSQKSHMLSKPIKKQKRAHEYYDSGDDDEDNVEEFEKKDESKSRLDANDQSIEIQWTREEDRLLLEQIKAGINSFTSDFSNKTNDFPNKTPDQIRNRIDFLIDFLTKLRDKNN